MILLSVGQEDIISILEQNRLTILVDLVEGHPNLHPYHQSLGHAQLRSSYCGTPFGGRDTHVLFIASSYPLTLDGTAGQLLPMDARASQLAAAKSLRHALLLCTYKKS